MTYNNDVLADALVDKICGLIKDAREANHEPSTVLVSPEDRSLLLHYSCFMRTLPGHRFYQVIDGELLQSPREQPSDWLFGLRVIVTELLPNTPVIA